MSDWKTTLAGLAGAVAVAWHPLIGDEFDWRRLSLAAAVAALGYFARDGGNG